MYPAAALMEVVEAYQIRIEAVMDAIDMKTFGLMAAIGKIELDNFRERASMGKRGSAKQGRMPTGALSYGYRIGDGGKPEIYEPEAEIVRRIFHMYVHEGMSGMAISRKLARDNAPTFHPGSRWHSPFLTALLGKEVYKGNWWYGKSRWVATEGGETVYAQPQDAWIKVPFPPLVDEQTWDRAQAIKKQRTIQSTRNTKIFYLLQHLVRCAECGRLFACRSTTSRTVKSNGSTYKYNLKTPYRHYHCYGMLSEGLRCREWSHIKAGQLEELVWSQVKEMIQNPSSSWPESRLWIHRERTGWECGSPGRSAISRKSKSKRKEPPGCMCRGRLTKTNSTINASSSSNGWKPLGRSWTTSAPGSRWHLRSGA